ncbi:Galacturonokinase [Abeliophyllum distichum]|uniref:Galacturonokinase n=1 Tax=Abeliophyllum distichum TaxID=126358 RepID=A0ABD1R3T4_9LAMI
MDSMHWPSESELDVIRERVAEISGREAKEVRVVISPYRICPLGAHIDHQGGTVLAMTVNKGILLGFVPSHDSQVLITSGQFKGEVRFSLDEVQLPRYKRSSSNFHEECSWGNYARGALYALQKRNNHLKQGITGIIYGTDGLDSSGLSSSAAVGIAYLLAFESANNLTVTPSENIEYDRLIENEYLGLRNGILDQSAILLSAYGCLTYMDCKTKVHKLIRPPELKEDPTKEMKNKFKILLAFSGLKQALTTNSGYNNRVEECQEAARVLLKATGNDGAEPILSSVKLEDYEKHKLELEVTHAKRAKHYFSENERVIKGVEAWASGNMEEFGKLISASGLSSIENYECGCEPLIHLYEILLKAPGVYGARFSGAGFRGCCIAFVDADKALEAEFYIKNEYPKFQPELASQMNAETVLICDAGDCARVI